MTVKSEARTYEWRGAIYSVRSRADWLPGDKFRCEYAVVEDDRLKWVPCTEGVKFEDIEPLVRLSGV